MLYGIFVIALIVLIASIAWKVKKKEKKMTTITIIVSLIAMFSTAPFIEIEDNIEKESKPVAKVEKADTEVDAEVAKSEKEKEKAEKKAEKEADKADKIAKKEKDQADKAAEKEKAAAEKAEKKKLAEESKENAERELTVDEKVEKVVHDTLGKKSNTKKDRIHEITINGDVANIWMNANENLSTDLTKKGMWRDALKLIEHAKDITEIELYQIIWMADFEDKYGNASENKIMKLDFTRETINKINFGKVDYNNAPEIADEYWEHGALK